MEKNIGSYVASSRSSCSTRQAGNESDVRLVLCDECGSEGRIYRGRDETDHGPCRACGGTGKALIEVEPITLEDLDTDAERQAEKLAEVFHRAFRNVRDIAPPWDSVHPEHREAVIAGVSAVVKRLGEMG